MFQYAVGRHLSIKNNTTLYLDTSWYRKKSQSTFVRHFALHHLNTCYKAFDKRDLLWWRIKASRKILNGGVGLRHKKEQDFSVFDSSVLEVGNNAVLDGYWNSHKYFESIRDVLLNEFRPKEEPDEKNRTYLKKIKAVDAISIHFRRGDYALTSFHGMLSKDYYTEAIKRVAEQVANPHLFLFSDEPEWVLANMRFDFPFDVVDFNKDEKNYWDIELMKNCKHNIIANSGFSWWAAWLNNNPHKQVVAPSKWVNLEKPSFDNMPTKWILL